LLAASPRHRSIPVPDPVIAMAEIGGDEVFWDHC
jgi:hypothetical protein